MSTTHYHRYIYWIPTQNVDYIKQDLAKDGYKFTVPFDSQCKALNTVGNKLGYLTPSVFNRVCSRQGSWYRDSDKFGQHAIVSDHPLPEYMQEYLDAEMTESNFQPEFLPSKQELVNLVESKEYRSQRPDDWEKPKLKDAILFKIMFTFTGFWGWGDNLKSTWLNHRANHANFLAKRFTTKIDNEDVPYTVSDNCDVCSSCVEFLNLVSQDSRKLVRACPGSITLAGVQRDVYYEIKPA